MKIYDITAVIGGSLPVYHKSERPEIVQAMHIKNGDLYNFSKFAMTMHTGTHADAPLHFVEGGAACDNVDLAHFYGKAKVFRLAVSRHVNAEDLQPLDIQAGDIVLLDLGQSPMMRVAEMNLDYLALTPCAARYLADKQVKTVGIDYLSVDPSDTTDFAVHKILLENGVAVLEGLVLEGVPVGEYTLSALPLKFENGNGSPVRAVLVTH